MSRQTEITFSARDNGVESTMSRLRRSSNELGRDMLQDAAKFSSTAKDAIKYYEDQIRLIQQRNKLDADQRRQSAQTRRDEALEGATTETQRSQIRDQYSEAIGDINEGTREDKIQVDLLRELIDTVKRTASTEAHAENLDSARDAMHAERMLLSGAGSEFLGLSDRYRDELQGGRSQGSGGGGGGFIGAMETGVGVANDPSVQNIAGAGGGLLKKAGPWGRGAAAIIAAGVGGFLAMSGEDESLTDISSITGRGLKGMKDDDFGLGWASHVNMKRDEFIQRGAQTTRAYGASSHGGRDLEYLTYRQVQIEKAFGLQAGQADEIAVLTRTLSDTFDSGDFMKQLYSAMADTGVLGGDNNDMSRMDAIVSTATSLATDQLMRGGAVGMGDNLIALRALSKMGGAFDNDQYLQSVVSGVDRGLSQAGGAETQALKYQALRRLDPTADVFDLGIMMEQGLATEGYFQSMLDLANSMSSDNMSRKTNLQSLLPGVDAAAIKEMIENPDFDMSKFSRSQVNISERQKATHSEALEFQHGLANQGKALMADFGNAIMNFNEAVNSMMNFFGGGSNSTGTP